MKAVVPAFLKRNILVMLTGICVCVFNEPVTAQCSNPPTLKFHSPVLISGTDLLAGAVYKFADVMPGVDANVEILGLYGGAILMNIDDSAGIGYYDAFQPYVGAGAGDTSYIEWRFTFKKSGTSNDTILPCLAVTGVDVDGDGSSLQEFIEAATPGSFSVDPNTNLTVSFDGVRSKAISPLANIAMIDTTHLEGMFQMNFMNMSTIEYRNGAITTGAAQVRQTSIYFKPFFQNYFLLPARLLSFTAHSKNKMVELKWSAAEESNLKYYILQRSENGRTWLNIWNITPKLVRSANNYLVNDLTEIVTTTYYRLKEVSINGSSIYSSIVKLEPGNLTHVSFTHNTHFHNTIRIQSSTAKTEEYIVELYSVNGDRIAQQKQNLHAGTNALLLDIEPAINAGIYLLVIRNKSGRNVYHSKMIRTNQ